MASNPEQPSCQPRKAREAAVAQLLIKRFAQLIRAALNWRTTIDVDGGLDAGIAHLRLDHIEGDLLGNRSRAEGVLQPVG